jgi:hypothetical protein
MHTRTRTHTCTPSPHPAGALPLYRRPRGPAAAPGRPLRPRRRGTAAAGWGRGASRGASVAVSAEAGPCLQQPGNQADGHQRASAARRASRSPRDTAPRRAAHRPGRRVAVCNDEAARGGELGGRRHVARPADAHDHPDLAAGVGRAQRACVRRRLGGLGLRGAAPAVGGGPATLVRGWAGSGRRGAKAALRAWGSPPGPVMAPPSETRSGVKRARACHRSSSFEARRVREGGGGGAWRLGAAHRAAHGSDICQDAVGCKSPMPGRGRCMQPPRAPCWLAGCPRRGAARARFAGGSTPRAPHLPMHARTAGSAPASKTTVSCPASIAAVSAAWLPVDSQSSWLPVAAHPPQIATAGRRRRSRRAGAGAGTAVHTRGWEDARLKTPLIEKSHPLFDRSAEGCQSVALYL